MKKWLKIGDPVWAKDKRVGTFIKLLVEPEGRKPDYIVVRIGRLRRREIMIPMTAVESLDSEGIKLLMDEGELLQQTDLEARVKVGGYRKPIPVGNPRPFAVYTPSANEKFASFKQSNIPGSLSTLRPGMSVIDASGSNIGKVQGVIAEDAHIEQLIVREPNILLMRDRIIPLDLIEDARDMEIHLKIDSDHF
jgi:hypothetical protein